MAVKEHYRWVMMTVAFLVNFFFSAFNMGVTSPLFPEMARDMGLSHTQLGVIWGALAFGIMTFSFVGGSMADRYGVKRVITGALALGALFCSARALFPDFWGMTIATFLMGATQGFVIPNLTKAMGQWFDVRELGTANGVLLVAIGTGTAIGSMIAASVLSPLLGGWRGVMWLTGGVTLAMLILWVFLARDHRTADVARWERGPLNGFAENLSKVIRIKTLWLLGFIECGIVGGAVAWVGMFPDILVGRGMTPAAAGVFMALGMWSAAPTNVLGPYLSDRLGFRKSFMWTSLILYTVALAFQGFVAGPFLAVMIVIWGIGRGVVSPIIRTIALETEGVGPHLGGSAIGLLFTLNRFGGLIWPIFMGMLVDYTGLYWPPLILLAALGFLALVLTFFVQETGVRVVQRRVAPVVAR